MVGVLNAEGKQVQRPWGKKETGILERKGCQRVGNLLKEGRGYEINLEEYAGSPRKEKPHLAFQVKRI